MITKVAKASSGAGKHDAKRSDKHQHVGDSTVADTGSRNPYTKQKKGKHGDDDDDEDSEYDSDGNLVSGGHPNAQQQPFIHFQGKQLNFDSFIEELHDKHNRDDAVDWLYQYKFKNHNVTSGSSGITPAMADALISGIKPALGLGGGGGKKKKGGSVDIPTTPAAEAARIAAVRCGTSLIVCLGENNRNHHLFDEWGSALFTVATGTIRALRSQMEDFVHEAKTANVVASPAGITSNTSVSQRKALAEIAGKCHNLLAKCFEALSLLYALDNSITVNEDGESLPEALLKLAPLVIPEDVSVASPTGNGGGNAFPTPDQLSNNGSSSDDVGTFYLPVEGSGALIKTLVACCEPAQGSKARAALLKLHRFVTGKTSTANYAFDAENDTQSSVGGGDDQSSNNDASSDSKASYNSLINTLIVALTESIGILGTRFPDMVARDESNTADDSNVSSPNNNAASSALPFTVTPLLSVEEHLVPLSKLIKRKGTMSKAKGKREATALLRMATKKLGSLNGSNVDNMEEHETNQKSKKNEPLPGSTEARAMANTYEKFNGLTYNDFYNPENLPTGQNPNKAAADALSAQIEAAAEEQKQLNATTFSDQTFDGADPTDVVQFRDIKNVTFTGFHQMYLAACLRAIVQDGLQHHLIQNEIIRTLFNITTDFTHASGKSTRHDRLLLREEADASKQEEKKERQRERDQKQARVRGYDDE